MLRTSESISRLVIGFALLGVACSAPRVEYQRAGVSTERVSERMPLQEGNSWTFTVTDDSDDPPTEKTQVVQRREVVGDGPNRDLTAFYVLTSKAGDTTTDKTESWQGVEEDPQTKALRVVRYREISYHAKSGERELEEYWDHDRLRVDDFHTSADPAWTEEYAESKIPADGEDPELDVPVSETWSVEADDEAVTVPAGTFHAAVFVRHADKPDDADKRYWFANGVGKVKEVGSKTEELFDCTVGGKSCAALAE